MLLNPKQKRITYVERKISEKQELLYTFSIDGYPDDIKNKIILFSQFKNYLEDIEKKHTSSVHKSRDKNHLSKNDSIKRRKTKKDILKQNENEKETQKSDIKDNQIDINNCIEEIDYIFVKKWLKTKHAMIFRFSNKIIQVCFKDKTQIIIHPVNKIINYTNKKGEIITYPINQALNSSNHEMNKRVKYTKEILAHMLSINKKKIEKNNINNNTETKEETPK